MRQPLKTLLAASTVCFLSLAIQVAQAQQQTQPLANPLRPQAQPAEPIAPTQRTPRAGKAQSDDTTRETAKPRRERSAKQKQNDEMMRACGAEWRAEKAALQAKGGTWRSFLKDCRAKKKTEQPV